MTRLSEAMAVVLLRFVSATWGIEQRLVHAYVQLLSKSLREEIARELIHVLTSTYNIGPISYLLLCVIGRLSME